MQRYEPTLERAQRLAKVSEGRAAAQATWVEELKRLGCNTADEEYKPVLMKEEFWSAYEELSRQPSAG